MHLTLLAVSLIGLVRSFKRKELVINEDGITLRVKRENRFSHMWTELTDIYLYGGGYPFNFGLNGLTFKCHVESYSISTEDFDGEDLRRALEIIKRYAAYYDIT